MTCRLTHPRTGQEAVFQLKENDLSITLLLPEEPDFAVRFDYGDFTLFSKGRPWQLSPAHIERIRVKRLARSVVVEAETPGFAVRDIFAWKGSQLQVKRRWAYRGTQPVPDAAVGSRIPAGEGAKEKITIPHVLYNDNPAADPDRLVPHLPREAGYALVVEEHRLPVPGVNVEWEKEGRFYGLTVFAMPSTATLPGAQADHAWTLGGTHTGRRLDILSLSGVVAFNNRKDVVYGGQNRAMPYPGGGYLTFRPGDTLEKTLAIDYGRIAAEGRGFRRLVRAGWELLRPVPKPALTRKETIALKQNALLSRWREGREIGGFTWIPDTPEEGNVYSASPGFLFGWVGQSLRLAWCALETGFRTRDESWLAKGRAVLDAFAGAPALPQAPGLRYLFYDLKDGQWYFGEWKGRDRISARMFGEALTNLADCLLLLKQRRLPVEPRWLSALNEGIAFLRSPGCLTKEGIYPLFFDTGGHPADGLIAAGGVACVTAILAAAEVTGDRAALEDGLTILRRYDALFTRTLERPFSRATLDAACEDKEAGIYYFLAACRAFRLTRDMEFGENARLAAEWITTFVYFWDVGFRPGTACAENGFVSTFWPGVSVQNMHLDVFFPPYEVYDLGRLLKDRLLMQVGQGVLQAWTHGIARRPGHWGFPTPGEQGEQFNHTNYYQGPFTIQDWRGGMNRWNPAWIIGLVLQAALRFEKTSG